jgi:hypothetical protein
LTNRIEHIARHVTHENLEPYLRHGWDCRFLYVRGDDLHCFIATFRCCR